MQIIDPHLHLFSLTQGDYHWLKPDQPPFWSDKAMIHADFDESDLQLNSDLTLAGFVHIEAGFDNHEPWREIAWLESQCQHSFRSIGCIDLTLPPSIFQQQIQSLMAYSSFVGVRHILDNHAEEILNAPQTAINLAYLAQHQYIFELQYSVADPIQHHAVMTAISAVPDLQIVLNHGGFPPESQEQVWQVHMRQLSHRDHLWVKASGWEMVNRQYSFESIIRHLSFLLNTFEASKIMLASNFPLVHFQHSYASRWQTYMQLPFTTQQLHQICYQNAFDCYRFHRQIIKQ